MNTRLFNNVLDGLSETETNSQAKETVNHIKWIAGHMVSTRYSMNQIGQFDDKDPYKDKFEHGKSIDPNAEYPSINELKTLWNNIADKISNGLSNMPEEALNQEATQTPIGDSSLRGLVAFLQHHEAYHLGQLGLLRKYAGKASMSYA